MTQQNCPFLAIDPSGSDVYGEISRIRSQGAAVQVELPGGVRAWWITSHELNKQLLAGPLASKDACLHWPAWINGDISHTWPMAIWVSVRNMITAYGADHSRLRKPVAAAFTKRRVEALRPRIAEIVERTLDDLELLPAGEPVDLRAAFAVPVPHQVVCELFGVPQHARAPLHRIIRGFFDTAITLDQAQANTVDLYRVLGELLRERRARPGADDDLTQALLAARERGELTEQELMDNLILLLTAGFETTVNLIENTVHSLLSHRDQLELVLLGKASWEDALEESVRHRAPAAMTGLRYAVRDIDTGPGGVTIPQGDPIVVSFASAGRDPRQHGPDADRFDVGRASSRDHLSFGHGAHHCLGRPLALAEGAIALSALFARFPGLALADPGRVPRPLASFISTGHQQLPVLLRG